MRFPKRAGLAGGETVTARHQTFQTCDALGRDRGDVYQSGSPSRYEHAAGMPVALYAEPRVPLPPLQRRHLLRPIGIVQQNHRPWRQVTPEYREEAIAAPPDRPGRAVAHHEAKVPRHLRRRRIVPVKFAEITQRSGTQPQSSRTLPPERPRALDLPGRGVFQDPDLHAAGGGQGSQQEGGRSAATLEDRSGSADGTPRNLLEVLEIGAPSVVAPRAVHATQ